MGPNYTQKDFHSKGNHKQSKKATHSMRENTCKQSDQEGIHLQNIQTAHSTQYPQEAKHSKGKWAEDWHFQTKHTDGQNAHETVLHVTDY